MARLGEYEFPEIGLTESVELARRIYDELRGEVRRDALAIVLGMSPSGGAFSARVSALRIWGLATGGGSIELTHYGERISSPTSPEVEVRVMRNLAASVPLFNDIYDRTSDSSVDQSVLAAILQEITGAEMDEIIQRVPVIERIFEGIRRHLNAAHEFQTEKNAMLRSDNNIQDLPEGWMEFRYEDGALRMRETVANLDMLIATLQSRRHRLNG